MPTFEEVADAARRLRRDGARVSVRPVRNLLPRGGSFGTIAPLLARWKAEAGYRPSKLPSDLPASLQGVVGAMAGAVWAAALAEAEKALERDRRKLALLERECELSVEAAWSQVDRLESELSALRRATSVAPSADRQAPPAPPSPGGARLGSGNAPSSAEASATTDLTPRKSASINDPAAFKGFVSALRKWASEREAQPPGFEGPTKAGRGDKRSVGSGPVLPPIRPLEVRRYWDVVMEDVSDLLSAAGRKMTTAEILAALKTTERGQDARLVGLKEWQLRRKLRERSAHTKFVRVDEMDPDRFEAIPPGARRTSIDGRKSSGVKR